MITNHKKALGFIFITVLIDVIGIGIIIPVVPALIKELIGGNISMASQYSGFLGLTYGLMLFLFSPVLGGLSDRFGRRPVLLLALLGLGFDYIIMANAPSIAWLFVGRTLAGICGGSFTTATAFIADISTPEKRAQNFGLVGAAFGVGFILGPMIGGFCGHFGARIPFYVAACFSLMNFIYGFFVLPESLEPGNRRAFDWKRANPVGALMHLRKYPVISGLVISFVLLLLGAKSVENVWSYFTIEKFNWDSLKIGISLAVVGVCVSIVQGGLIRVIIPKIGQKNAVYMGFALYSFGLFCFAFASQGWMMYVILIPYCLGGICGPALQGIMSGQVPLNEQGELQGALTSLMSVTTILGPLIMNNLFSYFTGTSAPIYFPGAAFFVGAILILIGMLFAIRSLKHYVPPANNGTSAPSDHPFNH